MKFLTILLPLFFLLSCSGGDEKGSSLCIQEMITQFQTDHDGVSFTYIYTFEYDGETYHIFDDGIAFDAIASVVNEDCEIVCTYGGNRLMNPNPCDDYQESIGTAVQIWPL